MSFTFINSPMTLPLISSFSSKVYILPVSSETEKSEMEMSPRLVRGTYTCVPSWAEMFQVSLTMALPSR